MPTKVTTQWYDPERTWELVETTVVTFSPGSVNIRLLDVTVTADDKLTLTFEVLK